MGVMKFRVPANDLAQRLSDYRKAYISGLDRTPGRVGVELRNGLMNCLRDTTESGRLFVPWPIDGYGTPIVGTATLAERPAPYWLPVELARGKLNDVRNQLADWIGMGLRSTPELGRALDEAQRRVLPGRDPRRPARCLPGGRPGLSAIGIPCGRPAHGGLYDPGHPEPVVVDVQAPDPSRLRAERRSPEGARGPGMVAHVQRLRHGQSPGSSWPRRRDSTAGISSMPSWPGAVAIGSRSRPGR